MRRLLPLLLLCATLTASATGVLNVLLGSGAVPAQHGTYSGTQTAVSQCPTGYTGIQLGSYVPDSCGSVSPTTDSNGHTIYGAFFSSTGNPLEDIHLMISGFSSDPGVNYFSTATFGGETFSPSTDLYRYSYSDGVADWDWYPGENYSSGAGTYSISYN